MLSLDNFDWNCDNYLRLLSINNVIIEFITLISNNKFVISIRIINNFDLKLFCNLLFLLFVSRNFVKRFFCVLLTIFCDLSKLFFLNLSNLNVVLKFFFILIERSFTRELKRFKTVKQKFTIEWLNNITKK